jgi:hypothetical protein
MRSQISWTLCLFATTLWLARVSAQDPETIEPVPAPGPRSQQIDLEPLAPSPLNVLKSQMNKLKEERDALNKDRTRADQLLDEPLPTDSESATKLRLRLNTLMTQMGSQKGGARPTPEPTSVETKTSTPTPPQPKKAAPEKPSVEIPSRMAASTDGPTALDPLALAQALFRAKNFDGSLQAYRMIPTEGMKAEERAPLQYMMAACLRKLGRGDEAAGLLRDVANSKGDEAMATCAQWQLSLLRWHRDADSQLKDIRRRRQELENKRE